MNILAIETSCDETATSIVTHAESSLRAQTNTIVSQIEMHRAYGGVVPNLAGGAHAENILPIIQKTLEEAKMTRGDIDAIAVTHGPGLMPALIIGVSAAKSLAYAWNLPLIGIHHIEGHIYSNWLDVTREEQPQFPLLALIVSGGHTQTVLMREHFSYEILGQTLDDAVGEAFDKVARILGLPYPGGPEIQKKAALYRAESNPYEVTLPRPMLTSGDGNFSFSGLKTAALYAVRDHQKSMLDANEHTSQKSYTREDYENVSLSDDFVIAVAHAFQEAAIDVLVKKTLAITREQTIASVVLAGGVSANTHLRNSLGSALQEEHPATTYHIPPMTYCLDNAAMIGAAAALRWTLADNPQKYYQKGAHSVVARPRIPIDQQ